MELVKNLFDEWTETPQEVDETYKLILQVVNVLSFCLVFTSSATTGFYISDLYKLLIDKGNGNTTPFKASFGEDYERSTIAPSAYAFSIWGPIYSGWAFFIFYQALPSEWVPSRNDKLIFNDIGYVMAANMVLNASWFTFNSFNNNWIYAYGQFVSIALMLATALYILYQSLKNEVDWFELIGLRGTFSIYAGWLSAATILATKAMFQYMGLRDVNNIYPNEESWGIIILWVAFIIYQATTDLWRNPLFGAVFTWAITACYDDISGRGTYKALESNIIAIDTIHTVSLFFYIAYFAYEKWGLEQEEYGLLYKIANIAQMIDYYEEFFDFLEDEE